MTAMMSHNCRPNAEQNIHDHSARLVVEVVAIRPIMAGEEITISYTELLNSTVSRQHSLLTSKLFLCQCERCRDCREGGSLASALKCPACLRKDPQSPGTLLPAPDLQHWTCDHCPASFTTVQIQNLIFSIQANLDQVMETSVEVEELERLLVKYGRVLHPTNGMVVRVKYSLCGLYGRAGSHQLFSLDSRQLERKAALCEETLTSLNILQPGFSCRRGLVLYELHTALLLLGRKRLEVRVAEIGNILLRLHVQVDKTQGRKDLKRSLQYLRECIKILSVQPESTFPGQLCLGVQSSQKQVEEFIKSQLVK